MGEDQRSLRILVSNVQNRAAEGPRGRRSRFSALADHYLALSPDFVCLQECTKAGHRDFEDFLGSSISGFIPRDAGDVLGEGCPIYVTGGGWQARDFSTFWLSRTPGVPSRSWRAAHNRIVSVLRVEDPGTGIPLQLWNTHFDHRSRLARRRGFALVRGKAASSLLAGQAGAQVLCGDLSAGPSSVRASGLIGCGEGAFRDSAGVNPAMGRRSTFRGFWGGRIFHARIDYCLYRGLLEATGYRVVDPRRSGEWLSDHRILVVDFVLGKAGVKG